MPLEMFAYSLEEPGELDGGKEYLLCDPSFVLPQILIQEKLIPQIEEIDTLELVMPKCYQSLQGLKAQLLPSSDWSGDKGFNLEVRLAGESVRLLEIRTNFALLIPVNFAIMLLGSQEKFQKRIQAEKYRKRAIVLSFGVEKISLDLDQNDYHLIGVWELVYSYPEAEKQEQEKKKMDQAMTDLRNRHAMVCGCGGLGQDDCAQSYQSLTEEDHKIEVDCHIAVDELPPLEDIGRQ